MSRFLNVVLTESPLDSPFAPKQKCIIPAIIGAASAIGSAIASIASQNHANNQNWDIAQMNANSVRETNKSNELIADRANALNYSMFKQQNAFNELMWNKQNSYNLPSNEVQRLRDAGINPAFAYGSSPSASLVSSAQPAPAQMSFNTAPQLDYRYQPVDYSALGNGVSGAINAYYENADKLASKKLKDSQREQQEAETERFRAETDDYLRKLQNEADGSGFGAERARRELQYFNESYDLRLRMLHGDASIQEKNFDILDEQLSSIKLDNNMKRIEQEWQPKMKAQEYSNLVKTGQELSASIGLINSNKLLSDEQRMHEIEKKAKTIIEKNIASSDKALKDELFNITVDSAREDLYLKEDLRYMRPFELNQQSRGKFGTWIPNTASEFGASEMYDKNLRRDRLRGSRR